MDQFTVARGSTTPCGFPRRDLSRQVNGRSFLLFTGGIRSGARAEALRALPGPKTLRRKRHWIYALEHLAVSIEFKQKSLTRSPPRTQRMRNICSKKQLTKRFVLHGYGFFTRVEPPPSAQKATKDR